MLNLKNLKELREQKGFTQSALADRISELTYANVNSSTISKWETGASTPTLVYRKALEEIFSIDDYCTVTNLIKKGIGIDNHRNISGKWHNTWSFSENDQIKEQNNTVEIIRNGNIIHGTSESEKYSYEIVGHLYADGILSGIWFSKLNNSKHHGVFMVRFSKSGLKGIGEWLGTYENDNLEEAFMHGKWLWNKA